MPETFTAADFETRTFSTEDFQSQPFTEADFEQPKTLPQVLAEPDIPVPQFGTPEIPEAAPKSVIESAKLDQATRKEQLLKERTEEAATGPLLENQVSFLSALERIVEPFTASGMLNQPARLTGQPDVYKAETPLVPREAALKAIEFASIETPAEGSARQGLQQLAANVTASLTTPEGIVTLPAAAVSGLVRAAFGAQMAYHLPGQTEHALEVLTNPTTTSAEKVVAAGEPVVTAAMITALAKAPLLQPTESLITQAKESQAPLTAAALEQVTKGKEDALQISKAETVLPDVRPLAKEIKEEVSAKVSPEEVPSPQGEIPLTPEQRLFASAGPGAASPAEFAQRQRPGSAPPSNPPVTIEAGTTPNVEVVRQNKDYNIFNNVNTGQWTFYFGRLGQAAKSAWERMALGEFRMRESIGNDVKLYVGQLLSDLPRPLRKQGGKAFFDIVNGRKMEEITAEWEAKPEGARVIQSAEKLKTRLEEIRATIRDTKRDSYRTYLTGLDKPVLEDLFRANISDQVDAASMSKPDLAHGISMKEFPDDWGIADGSYLPHLFFGNWKVTASSGETSQFVTRAKTLAEAKARIYELTRNNPEYRDAAFKVEQDTVVPADMIRIGDRKFWQLVSQMKEKLGVTAAEVREAQTGIIGRKSSKQKWFGSLQQREGFANYSRDFQQVMTAYLNGFHRWKELSTMQREVQPMIDQVKAEGRQNAAARLEELMENLWGKPARSTSEFDAFIRQVPVFRDYIKPLALDRWSRAVRTITGLATLRTVRFALVNRLQPLQGLYPIAGERLLIKAKAMQHTAAGRTLLDEAGVRFDPGQYGGDRGFGKAKEFTERLSGERSNQEWAFLAMYLHGTERGLQKADAINYAKLRGQLMTQFTPLVSDTPRLFEGPAGQAMFQFKRFPVKQVELAARMAGEKNFSGLTRMMAMFALLGGASFFLRQAMIDPDKKLRLRNLLKEELGDKGADVAMYGLPGLIGADISGSIVLGDEPYGPDIYSKVARQLTGPAVSLAIEGTKAATAAAREPIAIREQLKILLRKFPTFKPLAELESLASGNTDILTPDGETKYRRTIKDALLALGAFRSAHEANIQLAVSAIIELKKESQRLKNRLFVESQKENGDFDGAIDAIAAFNDRWPEAAITGNELNNYLKARGTGLNKTDVERIAGKKYHSLIPE